MISPTDRASFVEKAPIKFPSTATGSELTISCELVVKAMVNANHYLDSLESLFDKLNFEIYETLGQRNLSGFVGEIFARFLANEVDELAANPHADGRPDLIDISSEISKTYLTEHCLVASSNGEIMPVRSNLAPYKYGGIEVKTSIGNPKSGYKKQLMADRGLSGFSVGEPRVDYLASITYWGHHTSCSNLVGLYYDYFCPDDRIPQILAAMHSELDPNSDWHAVSIGKKGSKKTSNTSLTAAGKSKLFNGIIAHIDSDRYIEKLRAIGLKI